MRASRRPCAQRMACHLNLLYLLENALLGKSASPSGVELRLRRCHGKALLERVRRLGGALHEYARLELRGHQNPQNDINVQARLSGEIMCAYAFATHGIARNG